MNTASYSPRTETANSLAERIQQRLFRTRAADKLPMAITHQRIYILPSRRGWAFLVSLLIMLIASINYSLSLGYALCFMLTGLFIATLMATYKNLAGLTIKHIGSAESIVGAELAFPFTLNSHRYERVGIDIGNANYRLKNTTIEADQEIVARFIVPAEKRGLQSLGRITVSSNYPLGLWYTWSYVHTDNYGLIIPRAENKPPHLPESIDSENNGDRKSLQGEIIGLRDYQPGDSPASIAWKAAAKDGELVTREFGSDKISEQVDLHWTSTSTLTDVEARLSRLAAWARLAASNHRTFSLTLPGATVSTGRGERHLRKVLKTLALHGYVDTTA